MAESEEEVDVLVRRVVKDITNAFKKNPNIDEIGLIPCVEARYNRSPIVLEENKLGVESWCVKFLLPYVHNKLLQHRQRKHWLDPEALVDITCTLLLLNPDFTTAWNVRKELVQCGTLNPEKDLYLGKLALTKFPKSPETWIHRRWVLQQVIRECCVQGGRRKERGDEPPQCDAAAAERGQQLAKRLARTLRQEMRVCADAADRYPSNYNAWSHRIWVLQHMARDNVKVLQEELSSMRMWVSMHVSDHSGFHYRQFLLKTLARQAAATALHGGGGPQRRAPLQANGEAAEVAEAFSEEEEEEEQEEQAGLTSVHQLFHQELELCTDLIQSYPGHETLWCHRRSVFYLWHHWRTGQQHPGTVNGAHRARTGSGETPSTAHTDQLGKGSSSSSSAAGGGACGTVAADPTTNRLPQASEAMDVDAGGPGGATSLPDPRPDTKRLKRGPAAAVAEPPGPPVLSFEHSFVRGILDGCHGPDQRRFAVAYKKWLDAVIGQ